MTRTRPQTISSNSTRIAPSPRARSAGRPSSLPRNRRPFRNGPCTGRRCDVGKRIVLYCTAWCGDCRAARRFLNERGIAYEEIDIDMDPAAAEIVMKLNDGMRKVPTLDIEGKIVSGDRFDAVSF